MNESRWLRRITTFSAGDGRGRGADNVLVERIERDGWVFCHGGSMLFAFRTAKPSVWGKPEHDCHVLWSNHRRNGSVLETSELGPYAGGGIDAELDRFAAAVTAKGEIDASKLADPVPGLTHSTVGGHRLEIVFRPFGTPYTDQHRIDGTVVDYRAFPLMHNAWVHQDVDGETLTLTHGDATRTYDFAAWAVAEARQKGRAPVSTRGGSDIGPGNQAK